MDVGPPAVTTGEVGAAVDMGVAPPVGTGVSVPGEGLAVIVGVGLGSGVASGGTLPVPPPENSTAKTIAITAPLAATAAPPIYQALRDFVLTCPPQVGQKGWVSGTKWRFSHLVGFIYVRSSLPILYRT